MDRAEKLRLSADATYCCCFRQGIFARFYEQASVGWAKRIAAHHWPWNCIGRWWAALTLGPPYGLQIMQKANSIAAKPLLSSPCQGRDGITNACAFDDGRNIGASLN
jgi:hypothetical protein